MGEYWSSSLFMCVFLHVKREIDQYSPIRTSPSVNKIYNVLFIFNLYCCDDFEIGKYCHIKSTDKSLQTGISHSSLARLYSHRCHAGCVVVIFISFQGQALIIQLSLVLVRFLHFLVHLIHSFVKYYSSIKNTCSDKFQKGFFTS